MRTHERSRGRRCWSLRFGCWGATDGTEPVLLQLRTLISCGLHTPVLTHHAVLVQIECAAARAAVHLGIGVDNKSCRGLGHGKDIAILLARRETCGNQIRCLSPSGAPGAGGPSWDRSAAYSPNSDRYW